METLIQANQTLHEAKKHHDTTIKIQSIPIADFRFLAFSDASFASKTNPNSHTGMLIMGTHKDIDNNVSCPVPCEPPCLGMQEDPTSGDEYTGCRDRIAEFRSRPTVMDETFLGVDK